MTGDDLVSRLEKVRKTGNGRWLACCPAHGDKHASLSVRELDDGRILLHCFAGCATIDVMGALGLAMWELFPQAADFHKPRERRPFAPMDVLRAVAQESLIAATSAANVAKGMTLSDRDRERLWAAASRLQSAYEVAHG